MFQQVSSHDEDDLEIIVGDCSQFVSIESDSDDDDVIFLGIGDNDGLALISKKLPKYSNSLPNHHVQNDVVFLGSNQNTARSVNSLVDQLQPSFNSNFRTTEGSISENYNIVDPRLEITDPTPDIQRLFQEFDQKFFGDILKNCPNLKLSWCASLTSSAGLFTVTRDRRTGQTLAQIKLSSKLLSLRPRSDLVETLLHEMIHAYIYFNNLPDNGEHGKWFKNLMRQINRAAGTNITVYHNFNNEVRYVKKKQRAPSSSVRMYPFNV